MGPPRAGRRSLPITQNLRRTAFGVCSSGAGDIIKKATFKYQSDDSKRAHPNDPPSSRLRRLLRRRRFKAHILLLVLGREIHDPTPHIPWHGSQAIIPLPLLDAEVVGFLFG